jgi:hypothetical protein
VHVEPTVAPAPARRLARHGQSGELIARGNRRVWQVREITDSERTLEARIERLEFRGLVVEQRLVGIAEELLASQPPLYPQADAARQVIEIARRQTRRARSSRSFRAGRASR